MLKLQYDDDRQSFPLCRIIRQYLADPTHTGPKPRGGAHNIVYDEATVMSTLLPWLEAPSRGDVSLDDMRDFLTESGFHRIPSRTTLSKWLEGRVVTVNSIARDAYTSFASSHCRDPSASQVHVTAAAADVAREWCRLRGLDPARTLFVAECKIAIWTKRNRGLDADDKDAAAADDQFASADYPTITMVLAVSLESGIVSSTTTAGDMQSDDFVSFITSTASAFASDAAARPTIVVTESSQTSINHSLTTKLQESVNLQVLSSIDAMHNIAAVLLDHAKTQFRSENESVRGAIMATNGTHWGPKIQARQTILSEMVERGWEAFLRSDPCGTSPGRFL